MIELTASDSNRRLFYADAGALWRRFSADADLVVFDPPWQIANEFSYMAASKSVLAFCDGRRCGDIIRIFGPPTWVFVWDCVSSWYTPNRPLQRGKFALWYGDISQYRQRAELYGEPCGKPRMVTNSRGSYFFEPNDGKMLSDVFTSPITSLHRGDSHRHSKPAEWVRMLIGNTTSDNAVILDPFAGGLSSCVGTTGRRRWIGGDVDIKSLTQGLGIICGGRKILPPPVMADMFDV